MKNYRLEIDGINTNIDLSYAIRAVYNQIQEFRLQGKIPAERVIDVYFETGYQFRFMSADIESVIDEFIGWRIFFKFLAKKRLKSLDKFEDFVLEFIVREFVKERDLENEDGYYNL